MKGIFRARAQQLGQLYRREKFLPAEALPESGRCILLGRAASAPEGEQELDTEPAMA